MYSIVSCSQLRAPDQHVKTAGHRECCTLATEGDSTSPSATDMDPDAHLQGPEQISRTFCLGCQAGTQGPCSPVGLLG